MKREQTADGTYTLYNEAVGDHYHSTNGARQESEHVFIAQGMQAYSARRISILEIGFGTGLNAFLTALTAQQQQLMVDYTAVDKYFPSWEIVQELGYTRNSSEETLLKQAVQARLNQSTRVGCCMNLIRHQADFTEWSPKGLYDVVYFDAFAPDKQPEMWTEDRLGLLYKHLRTGGLLVTYSAKGSLRRLLQHIGFEVERLPGPPGKRHTVRARKSIIS